MQNSKRAKDCLILSGVVFLSLIASVSASVPIDIDSFFKEPASNITIVGQTANLTEDSEFGFTSLSLDPSVGDSDLITPQVGPGRTLLFDFNFELGNDESDEFLFSLFDATANETLTSGSFKTTNTGTVRIDLDPFLSADSIGLEFQLLSLDFPPSLGSTLSVDDLRVIYDPTDDGQLDADDVNQLRAAIISLSSDSEWDPNGDGLTNLDDLRFVISHETMLHTYFGDSNLDGEFSSDDLISVFKGSKFRSVEPADWAEGDWNADGLTTTEDLILAFADGGYERGPRGISSVSAATVPEPTNFSLIGFAIIGLLIRLSRRDLLRKTI